MPIPPAAHYMNSPLHELPITDRVLYIPHHLLANMYNQYEEEEVSYYLYNAISEKIELVVY